MSYQTTYRFSQYVKGEVEEQLGLNGALASISGFAAKMAEHAARLAGALRMFDNADATTIGLVDLERGIKLVRYYAKTALRLEGVSQINRELLEAEALLRWMHHKFQPEHGSFISLADVVQIGPNPIRDTKKARGLLTILADHRHVVRVAHADKIRGKKRGEVWQIRFCIFTSGAANSANSANST